MALSMSSDSSSDSSDENSAFCALTLLENTLSDESDDELVHTPQIIVNPYKFEPAARTKVGDISEGYSMAEILSASVRVGNSDW